MADVNATTATEVACTVSTDCPGAQVCYVGVSWSDVPVCECKGWFGKFGPDCDEPTPYFYVSVIIMGAGIACALVLAAVSIKDACLVSKYLGGLRASSSNMTPVFNTATLLSLGLWKTSFMMEFVLPGDGRWMVIDEDGYKDSKITDVGRFLNVFLTTTLTLGLLNMSLMWLEVSRKAFDLSQSTKRKMNIYRKACIVAGVFVTSTNLFLCIIRQVNLAALVNLPNSMVLIVLFILGRRGMESVMHHNKLMDTSRTASAFSERLERTVKSIRLCCNRTVRGCIMFMLLTVTWWWLIILSEGSAEYTRPGVGCWPQLLYEFVPWSVLYVMRAQVLYSHNNVRKRVVECFNGHASSAAAAASRKVSTNPSSTAKVAPTPN